MSARKGDAASCIAARVTYRLSALTNPKPPVILAYVGRSSVRDMGPVAGEMGEGQGLDFWRRDVTAGLFLLLPYSVSSRFVSLLVDRTSDIACANCFASSVTHVHDRRARVASLQLTKCRLRLARPPNPHDPPTWQTPKP